MPLAYKCQSSDFNEVMGKIYNWLAAPETEQKRMKKDIENINIPARMQKANASRLCSKENIEAIISEFPHLEDPFINKYIPNWDELGNIGERAKHGIDYVGRASNHEVRMQEVQKARENNKKKAYKRPKAGEFLKNERQLCLSHIQATRNKLLRASGKFLDSIHIPDKPFATKDESMISIFVTSANTNKNTGGFRRSFDRTGDQTTLVVVRESREHLEHIMGVLKEASKEDAAIEEGTMNEDERTIEKIIFERPTNGEVKLKDVINEKLKPQEDLRENPKRKRRSIESVHTENDISSTPFGVKQSRRFDLNSSEI